MNLVKGFAIGVNNFDQLRWRSLEHIHEKLAKLLVEDEGLFQLAPMAHMHLVVEELLAYVNV